MKDSIFVLIDKDSKEVKCASSSFKRITLMQKSFNEYHKGHIFNVLQIELI